MHWRHCSLELNHRYVCLYLCLNKNVDSGWLILTDSLIHLMVSLEYQLTDHPELRWTTQPAITGGQLGEQGFGFFAALLYVKQINKISQ